MVDVTESLAITINGLNQSTSFLMEASEDIPQSSLSFSHPLTFSRPAQSFLRILTASPNSKGRREEQTEKEKREKTGRKINNESQSSASLRPRKERFWIKRSEMFQNKNKNKTVTLSFRTPSRKWIGVAQPGKRCQNWRETARSSGWSCWPALAVSQFMS